VSGVSSAYQQADSKLGGYLPGGQTPAQVQAERNQSLVQQGGQSLMAQNIFGTQSQSNPFLQSNDTRGSTLTTQSTQSNQSSVQSELGQTIQQARDSTPLGTPNVQSSQPWYKRALGVGSDALAGAFAPVGAGWTAHFSQDTARDKDAIKEDFKDTLRSASKDYVALGIPGVVGITGEGKFIHPFQKKEDGEEKEKFKIGDALKGSPISAFQVESYEKFREWRSEKDNLKAIQEAQADAIKSSAYRLGQAERELAGQFTDKELFLKSIKGEISQQDRLDLTFGKKNAWDIDETKKDSYGYQSKIVEQEIAGYSKEVELYETRAQSYESWVEDFNKKYGGKELSRSEYDIATRESTQLERERQLLLSTSGDLNLKAETLQKQTDILGKQYSGYVGKVGDEVKTLRQLGIDTKIDEQTGSLDFVSKELKQTIKPVGWQVQEGLKKDDGSLSWKNIAYGGASLVPVATEFAVIGLATGGTGVLAKVGSGIAKLPKVAKIGVYAGIGTLAVAGVTMKGISGYSYAKQSDLPGWFGATIGVSTSLTEIGGFMAGGYVGTKLYMKGVESQILAGKYTKSVAETRTGTLVYDDKGAVKGGLAKQMGLYDTKIKGTDYVIRTGTKMTGVYDSTGGTSKINMFSQFVGKQPKGMPKSFKSQGQSLESLNWLKVRMFSKPISAKGVPAKNWYSQDLLISRKLLSSMKVSVKGKPGFEGYQQAELMKILSGIKTAGKPVKVGKVLPKDIFSKGEISRFLTWKGQGKVAQPWEFGEGKLDSVFGTKQLVFYKTKTPVKVGGGQGFTAYSDKVFTMKFDSISQSKGLSADLLKQALALDFKGTPKPNLKLMKFKNLLDSIPDALSKPMNKRGQVQLFSTRPQPQHFQPPKPKVQTKTTFDIPKQTYQTQDLRVLVAQDLQRIVPGLLKQQLAMLTPQILVSSIAPVSTYQVLKGQQQIKAIQKQNVLQRQQSLQIQQLQQMMIPQLQTQVKQVQQIKQVQQAQQVTQIISPTIPFVNPIVTGFPIIPGLPKMLPGGTSSRQGRGGGGARKQDVYIPDFTAKALGVSAKKTNAQIKRLLKETFSGFEIRPSVEWA
jgi:hypothetical protein